MNIQEYLLDCLGEESAEVTQVSSKCNRFGLGDRNVLDLNGPTNLERLVHELNDVLAVIAKLVNLGVIPKSWMDETLIQAKLAKLDKFMDYARSKGTLE